MKLAKWAVAVVVAVVALFGVGAGSPRAEAAGPKGIDLVQTAIAVNSSGPYAGQFDTLIAAVLAADPAVLARLSGNGQLTVFAPTDAAFEQLGVTPANVGNLPKSALTQILLYHVANGRRDASEVLTSSQIRTLQGGFLMQNGGTLTDTQGRVATIIVTNVEASNGIIHAIDKVVLPFALN